MDRLLVLLMPMRVSYPKKKERKEEEQETDRGVESCVTDGRVTAQILVKRASRYQVPLLQRGTQSSQLHIGYPG